MQPISESLKEFKPKKGPTSKRAYWVDLTAKMLNESFLKVLGLTREWKQDWIMDMYLNCYKTENPARLWWGLRKKNK